MFKNMDGAVAFDIETVGIGDGLYALQPWRVPMGQARIRCYALAGMLFDRNTANGFDCDDVGICVKSVNCDTDSYVDIAKRLTNMIKSLVATNTPLICWNAVFELSWCAAYGVPKDLLYRLTVIDGMALFKHVFNYAPYFVGDRKVQSYGLKEIVKVFKDVIDADDQYAKDVKYEGDLAHLIDYNKKDALYTYKLVRWLWNKIYDESSEYSAYKKATNLVIWESSVMSMFGYSYAKGLPINQPALFALKEKLDAEIASVMEVLTKQGCSETVINSPKQLSAFFFSKHALSETSFGYSVNKYALNELYETIKHERQDIAELIKLILKYKELVTKRRKFVDAAIKSLEYTGTQCIHPPPLIFGTYSGRVTYSTTVKNERKSRYVSWALHQTQRDKDVRSLLRAPDGYVLVEFDAAGQEFRWMAVMSQDEKMISLCQDKDPHAYMGMEIYNLEHSDTQLSYAEFVAKLHAGDEKIKFYRQLGKIANLSCQYRIGSAKLQNVAKVQYGIPLTQAQADMLLEAYKNTYAGVVKYWSDSVNKVRQLGYVETKAGRRVRVPKIQRSQRRIIKATLDGTYSVDVTPEYDYDLEWKVESTAINFPIQGVGADQKYFALYKLRPLLIVYDAWFAFDLHDGIYIFVRESQADDFINDALQLLNKLDYSELCGESIDVRMTFDCKRGKTWGDMTPV